MRHNLLGELTEDSEEHEYGEHLILETLLTERRLVEDEADKEGLGHVRRLARALKQNKLTDPKQRAILE